MVKVDTKYPKNRILVGQNRNENDQLVAQSQQTDLWFHLKDLPSCHVILECDKDNEATKEMINYAAQLVKENTKYKNYKKITVEYTEIKNVYRTKTPGLVTIKGKIDIIIV